MSHQISDARRAVLAGLAQAIFPLEEWLATKKYTPNPASLIPPEPGLPWRPSDGAAATLSTASMEAIAAFEQMLADGSDEALAPRWLMLKVHPLAFFQYGSQPADAWRKARNLDPAASFAPFAGPGANMNYVVTAGDKTLDPVPRAEYYEVCFSLLDRVVAGAGGVPTNGQKLSDALLKDAVPAWPSTETVSSQAFIKRFAADLMVTCMGQKNPALIDRPAIWQRAVLIEAGENRHVGNEYAPSQTAQGVVALLDKIASSTTPT